MNRLSLAHHPNPTDHGFADSNNWNRAGERTVRRTGCRVPCRTPVAGAGHQERGRIGGLVQEEHPSVGETTPHPVVRRRKTATRPARHGGGVVRRLVRRAAGQSGRPSGPGSLRDRTAVAPAPCGRRGAEECGEPFVQHVLRRPELPSRTGGARRLPPLPARTAPQNCPETSQVRDQHVGRTGPTAAPTTCAGRCQGRVPARRRRADRGG